MQTILFFSRLILFYLVILIPFFMDPAVAVAYDFSGKVAWLFLLPAQMLIAYFIRPPRTRRIWMGPAIALGFLAFIVLFFSDFEWQAVLLFTVVSLFAYISTRMVFSGKGPGFAVLEMFFIGLVYFKLLNFTRSAPDIAEASGAAIKIVLILAVLSFLLHAIILYLAAFPDRSRKRKRAELVIFSVIAVLLLFPLAVLLPDNFVDHEAILNNLREEPPPRSRELDQGLGEDGQGLPGHGPGQGGQDSGNGLPLGGHEPRYPSERNKHGDGGGTGDVPQDGVPERGQRPDENRGGGGQGQQQNQQEGGGQGQQQNQQEGGGQGQQQNQQEGGGQGQQQNQQEGGGQGQQQNQQEGGGQGQQQNQQEGGGQGQQQNQQEGGGQGQQQNQQEGGQGQQQNQQEGGQGQQQNQQQNQQQQDPQRLEGIPSDQWNNRRSMQGAGGKQMAVMVIASRVDPVYAAESYWGVFDAGNGFQASSTDVEPLNKLTNMKLIETWEDNVTSRDDMRQPVPLYFLSTLPQRQAPYRPFQIQPTVRDVTYHPFDYSYNVIARMSMSEPKDWYLVRDLDVDEEERLAEYLELDVDASTASRLRGLIDQMKKEYINERNEAIREAARENNPDAQVREITDDLKYFERIDALHHGFHAYKYKLGYDEDMNMQKLSQFLFQEKEGDCTEFAQSLAMLGRLEGIPSRVVVGYLASRDLQTRAHVSGLYHLQKKIEPLQKFELEEMYLVTTSHAHAWVQFYLPGYGWIDFESTTYAIPPEPEFNPNGMDVVIPLIDEETNRQPADAFQFPWLLAGKVLGVIAVLLIVSLYCLRFGREVYLNIRAGKLTAPGLQAMLSHLLMKMARDGYALKQPHMTPLEYAEQYRALEEFAALHTMLRFRVNYAEGERQAAWQDLRNKRRAALKSIRKAGLWAWIKRRFSLRGLFYLKG